jgi:hypothetical protein
MTRTSLHRMLRRLYFGIGFVLAVSLLAKFADHVPYLRGTAGEAALKDVYEFLRDMSLLIATGGVAYLTNVFQKRSTFVQNLEQEWRNIVRTKSALFAFCEKQYATADDYVAAFCRISETIDNMRIIYRNVGETEDLIGLYPYAPLHDMRRALQTLDPRKGGNPPAEQRALVRNAILQGFYALRESFLDELDMVAPDNPLLIHSGRRLKRPGSPGWARNAQDRQRRRQDREPVTRPDIDEFLRRQYEIEEAAGKAGANNGRPRPV